MKQRAVKIAVLIVSFFLFGTCFTALSYRLALARAEAEKSEVIEQIVTYLKGRKVDIGDDKLKAMVNSIYKESQQADLDYRLALAVVQVESNFKHDVVSNKGARGLFQIKPSLAKYIAKDAGVNYNGDRCLQEPDKNIKLGVYHLSKLVDDFKSLPTALHAYNAGTSRIKSRTSKNEPKTAFTKRVLKEYEKNMSVLPDVDMSDK
jgi:soluble lytic murein transglycosylase